jgi:hypothetical protein
VLESVPELVPEPEPEFGPPDPCAADAAVGTRATPQVKRAAAVTATALAFDQLLKLVIVISFPLETAVRGGARSRA